MAALLPVRVKVCPVVSALAVIVFDPLPVAIDSPEATATVVTFRAPLTPLAARSPRNPVTVSAAEPASVKVALSASAVAVTVTTSLAPLAVIEVAAEPVVIEMVLSVASPVVTVSAPVREPGRDIPDQSGHHLRCRADQRQRDIVGQRRRVHRYRIAGAVRGDRGRG